MKKRKDYCHFFQLEEALMRAMIILASMQENLSSGVSEKVIPKPTCSATEIKVKPV